MGLKARLPFDLCIVLFNGWIDQFLKFPRKRKILQNLLKKSCQRSYDPIKTKQTNILRLASLRQQMGAQPVQHALPLSIEHARKWGARLRNISGARTKEHQD